MDFASDSAQEILLTSRRESEEGKTEKALHIQNSQQTPKQASSVHVSTSGSKYTVNVPQSETPTISTAVKVNSVKPGVLLFESASSEVEDTKGKKLSRTTRSRSTVTNTETKSRHLRGSVLRLLPSQSQSSHTPSDASRTRESTSLPSPSSTSQMQMATLAGVRRSASTLRLESASKKNALGDSSASALNTRLCSFTLGGEELYKPRVVPPLFENTAPIPTKPRKPIVQPLTFQRHEKNIKSLQAVFSYTVSDDYIKLDIPTVVGVNVGDVHIHRNRLTDNVDIWVFNKLSQWINCTDYWGIQTNHPIRHPLYCRLILDTVGENSWIPTYIKETTYQSRSPDRPGLAKYQR